MPMSDTSLHELTLAPRLTFLVMFAGTGFSPACGAPQQEQRSVQPHHGQRAPAAEPRCGSACPVYGTQCLVLKVIAAGAFMCKKQQPAAFDARCHHRCSYVSSVCHLQEHCWGYAFAYSCITPELETCMASGSEVPTPPFTC